MVVAMMMSLAVYEKKMERMELYKPLRDYIVIDKSLPFMAVMKYYLVKIKQMRNDM